MSESDDLLRSEMMRFGEDPNGIFLDVLITDDRIDMLMMLDDWGDIATRQIMAASEIISKVGTAPRGKGPRCACCFNVFFGRYLPSGFIFATLKESPNFLTSAVCRKCMACGMGDVYLRYLEAFDKILPPAFIGQPN
jgi:hypothetical protein